MASAPWSVTLKAILFIGLLFGVLIVAGLRHGVEGFRSKDASPKREGFQSYGGTVKATRPSTDPLDTPAETPEEQVVYDLYEEKNIPIPPDPYYTPLQKYNTAGQLTQFDMGAEVPWDYDNKDMDPQEILWGTVYPECSQSIFTKAYNREMFSSGNNVEMDQGTGQFFYRSNVFQTTVYDEQSAAALQYLEFIQDFATEEIFEGILGGIAERTKRKLDAMKARDAATKRANKLLSMSPADAVKDVNARVDTLRADLVKEKAPGSKGYTTFVSDFPFENGGRLPTAVELENFQKVTQAELDEALTPLERKILKGEAVNKTVDAIEDGKSAYAKVYQEVVKEQAEKTLEKARILRGQAGGMWARTKLQASQWANKRILEPGKKALAEVSEAARLSKLSSTFAAARKILQTVMEKLTSVAAIRLLGATLSKVLMSPLLKAAGAFFAKAVGRLIVGLGVAMGVLTLAGPVGWAIEAFLMVFSIACIAIVPAFMSVLVDPDPEMSKCPIINGKETFNIRDSIVKSSGAGEAGWEILSAIPVLGDVMYAIGPYICSEPDGTAHLRVPFQPPPYYFDSTLSIFYANKPNIQGCTRDIIKNSVDCRNADIAYRDVRQYYECKNPNKCTNDEIVTKSQWNIYWVDFANKKMLDKMAQHYMLTSRKFYNVEYDGRISYEYISKFYGIIASSQYSCDVQCEITKVVFEPYSGNKYEKIVLDPPRDTGMRYHDRRFYFTVDVRKGLYKPSKAPATDTRLSREGLVKGTVSVPTGVADKWDALMNDNMDKYVITGCTHVNGTGYDASDGSAEGEYVGDAVVALGNPGENYSPPIMVLGKESDIPKSETECDAFRVSYSRPGMRYAPAQRGSEGSSVPIVGNIFKTTAIVEPWGANNQKGEVGSATEGFQVMLLEGSETKEWGVTRQFPSRLGEGFGAAFTGVMGYLPLRWGFMGGIVATTTQSANVIQGESLGSALSCLWQDVKNQTGTFILNARTLTNTDNFIINRGPTLEFAPGYTPTLRPCELVDPAPGAPTQAGIQLTSIDCANRFSLRRAIQYYHSNYKEGSKQFRILKIFDIEPRRITKTNPTSMCVYSVEEVEFDPLTRANVLGAVPRQSVIGIEHALVTDPTSGAYDDTCVFYPTGTTVTNRTGIRNSNSPDAQQKVIPVFEPIQMNFKEYDFSKSDLPPSTTKFTLRTCNNNQPMDCSNPALRSALQAEFDLVHFAKDYTVISDPVNLVKTYTPPQTVPGQFECVYVANLEKTDYNLLETDPGYKTRITDTITMTFKESVTTGTSTCAVELLNDSFSLGYSYSPIPGPNRWFDVPVPPYPVNPNILRTSCTTTYPDKDDPRRIPYSSCAGTPIVTALVQGFNERYDDRKILRVFRANSPLTATVSQDSVIECDYEVDMMRVLKDGSNLVQRETLRLQGTAVTDPKRPCDYQFTNDYSGFPNSGVSIEKTGLLDAKGEQSGALAAPVLWTTSFLTSLRNQFNSVIAPLSNVGGKTIPEAMKAVSRPARVTMDNLNSFVVGSQTLANCPSMTCSSEELMRRVVNRYNFDNYPDYPKGQFGVVKRTLERIRRAGFGGPSTCHFELIERIDTYNDFVEKPVTTQYFLRKYQFNIENSQSTGSADCSYRIQPLSKEAIANNVMDISGNPYGIRADQSLLTKEYIQEDTVIDCMNADVLQMVKRAYESTNTRKTPPRTPLNTLKQIKFGFTPRPNVCEYCVVVDHVNYDKEYGMTYNTQNDTTYIVVKWDENTAYNVDGAQIRPNAAPTSIEEYFPGDIDVRADGAYLGTTRVDPPYLFFEGVQDIESNPSKYRVVVKSVDMTKV